MIEGLVSIVADRLSLQAGRGFRHRGVAVFHEGLLDQERVTLVIDKIAQILSEKYGAQKVEPLLSRTVVRFVRPSRRRIQMTAGWTGGLIDRAEVVLYKSDKWSDDLARGVLQTLLMELDPQLQVDELFGEPKL